MVAIEIRKAYIRAKFDSDEPWLSFDSWLKKNTRMNTLW